ncbi:hypothetical protein E4J66_12355 [Actinomyces viscosus]|uniref:Uncharacterized protein n=1 Tax=Actinomyces viscosus TaxID=1656 RepID=A0A448PMD3_ACTVI|nr:hypothetical protein [Actinomyces viscosus]TFH51323.1 hypothetical protein E4J66_12355 [Actinomyces viscosus]VEI17084.1 Uncharacterised protein [Actinomyces viscosus]
MTRAEIRPVNRAGTRRRAAVVGCLLLAGSLVLSGCSSSGSRSGEKSAASSAGATGHSTSSPSGVATASGSAGPVTAASLSDAQLGYTITSIPAGLDVTQVKVLQDFVAYDQMSWRLWVDGGQDVSKVPTVTTGTLQQQLTDDAANLRSRGEKAKTPVKVAVSEVAVSADGQSATVSYCVDMTQVTYVDAQGKDVTDPTVKAQVPARNTMVPGSDGRWLASEEEETGEPNTCSVG